MTAGPPVGIVRRWWRNMPEADKGVLTGATILASALATTLGVMVAHTM